MPNAKYLAFGTPDENSLRNQVIFQDGKVDIQLSSNRICRRALEFSSLAVEEHLSPLLHPLFWSPPSEGSIKLNVDTAVSSTLTTLSVVARDHTSTPIKAWIKSYCSCLPAQAKAATMLWAVNLALAKGWMKVVIKGDAKECFDALSDHGVQPSWIISNFVCDILALSKAFCSVSFVWVRRVCNSAAHYATKLALRTPCFMFFLKDSLPVELLEVCKADLPPVLIFFNEILLKVSQKKKKNH